MPDPRGESPPRAGESPGARGKESGASPGARGRADERSEPPVRAGASPGARTFYEDVVLDAVLETPAMTLTEAHVHLFEGFAGPSVGPGAVHDLLPICVSSGLGWRVPQPPLAVAAFMGYEWRFLAPLRVGDTIRSRSRTVTKRAMRDGGVIIEQRDIVNQRGEVVQSGRITLLVERRATA